MLQRIHIENFKSLKDVTLDLQPVNLLIGPNNSGKSNLLKALYFFETYDLTKKPPKRLSEYLFARKTGNFKINLTFYFENDIHLTFSKFNEKNSDSIEYDVWESDLRGNENSVDKQFLISSRRFLREIIIYKPDPAKLTKSFPLLPNQEIVIEDTSNLVAFLDILRDKYRDNFEAIEQDLQKCIPEFSRIQLENVAATEDLIKLYGDKTFKRLGLYNAQQKITYWADELSEGTLYFLALLCIIHQPIPPKLLLLEEPEKGIHPRRIKEVIDFIFDLAREKDIQVIMTTHHPYVVNEFQDIPEAVFIFDKDDEGATQIRNLQHDIIEPSDKENDEKGLPHIKFTQDLAEHWVLGFMGGVPK
jgi:predicted ATPase